MAYRSESKVPNKAMQTDGRFATAADRQGVRRTDAMESVEDRLERFLNGSPNEVFFTILNSLHNFLVKGEIRIALESGLYTLAMFGSHAVMQTIGEQIYGLRGPDATTHFLREFVDAACPEADFASIAAEIHELRNVGAHRWSATSQHSIVFDLTLSDGWERRGTDLHFNVGHFLECFILSFQAHGPMWELPRAIPAATAQVRKYRYLARWLELDRGDEISRAIRGLDADETTLDAQLGEIDSSLRQRFAVPDKKR